MRPKEPFSTAPPGELLDFYEAYVYRVGDKVWKVYPTFSEKTIILYTRITDTVRQIIAHETIDIISTPLCPNTSYSFTWEINPIEAITTFNGYPTTISPYIPGPNLSDLIGFPPDQGNRHPLVQIIRADKRTVIETLTYRSEKISGVLGPLSVWFVPVNVKPDLAGNKFIVTDIYPRIGMLEDEGFMRVRKAFRIFT